jgi:AraC-like DNA-binding protein
MVVVGALLREAAVQKDVSRQLAPTTNQLRIVRTSSALVAAAQAQQVHVAIIELHDEMGTPVRHLVERLTRSAQPIPVIIYDDPSSWRVDALREILSEQLPIAFVARTCDALAEAVTIALDPLAKPPMWHVLFPRLLERPAPGVESFIILAALKAPQERRLSELSRRSGLTLRTIQRRLRRAGWASPRTIVQSVRALDAAWLMSEWRYSAGQVQDFRRFSHPSEITRLLQRHAGTTPAQIRAGAGFRSALDTVLNRLQHRRPRGEGAQPREERK